MIEEIDGVASVGNIIRYKLTVKNPNKNLPIHNFVVTDPLPAHLALVAGSIKVVPEHNAHIIETNSANEIRVVFTSLAAAAIVQIHFDAKIVGSGADGKIVNTARIHKHKPDPQGGLGVGLLGKEVNRADEIVEIEKDSATKSGTIPKETANLNGKETTNKNGNSSVRDKEVVKTNEAKNNTPEKDAKDVETDDMTKNPDTQENEKLEQSEATNKLKSSDNPDQSEMTLKGMLSSISTLLTSKLNGTPKKDKIDEEQELQDEKILDQQYDQQYDQEYDQEFDQLFGD